MGHIAHGGWLIAFSGPGKPVVFGCPLGLKEGMPTTLRLYVPQALTTGKTLTLPADQAHYLAQVMRRKPGDSVEIFNGEDGAFHGTLMALSRRAVNIDVGVCLRSPGPENEVTLYFAVVKRGPVEMIVQKATELGATRLQPLITERTMAKAFNRERLCAIAREASEQCERLSVPSLGEPDRLETLLAEATAPKAETRPGLIFFADEAGDNPAVRWGGMAGRAAPLSAALHALAEKPASLGLLIGPEGGFTAGERERLRAAPGIVSVGLGPRILRADTAAIAGLAIIQSYLETTDAAVGAPVEHP
ncbi:MAG: 16S rRNA (uracil(1498)-N(3))-methyltransferase [Pseudomonadota bacterium]